MLEKTIFLGLPVDPSLATAMNAIAPGLLEIYQLSDVVHQGVRYLGKYPGDICSIADISLLQDNIYSILTKLTPGYSFEKNTFLLFTMDKVQ